MTMGASTTIADVLGGVLALAYTVISALCVAMSPVGPAPAPHRLPPLYLAVAVRTCEV